MKGFSQTSQKVETLIGKLERIHTALSLIDEQILSVKSSNMEYDLTWNPGTLKTQTDILNEYPTLLNSSFGPGIDDRKMIYRRHLKRFIAYAVLFNKATNRNHIQLAAFQSQIISILTATDDFEVFLNSLNPKPADTTVLNLIKQIDKNVSHLSPRIDSIKTRVNIIDTSVHILASSVEANGEAITEAQVEIRKARTEIAEVNDTAKKILRYVTPLTTPRGIVGGEAFGNDAFGAFYYFKVGKGSDSESRHIGLEVIVPIRSTAIKGAGGFVSYGIRENHLLLSAELGYLYDSKPQNISWKIDAMLFIKNEGIGICYSPITNVGVKVAIRLP